MYNDVLKNLSVREDLFGYILEIYEDDYGCEERLENEPLKVVVKILTRDGITYKRIEDSKLTKNNKEEGTYISFDELKVLCNCSEPSIIS